MAQYPEEDMEMLADITKESKIYSIIIYNPIPTMDRAGNLDLSSIDKPSIKHFLNSFEI
jgi:hypothetical protein